MKPTLLCVTGIDGAGKSTVCDFLNSNLHDCHISNIWDLMELDHVTIPFKSKLEVDNFLCHLTPDSRLLFLAHAMQYSVDKAFASGKQFIVANSYYYKYFATELALGANPQLVASLMQAFPQPQLVIELVVPPQTIVIRKKHYSRYECGLATTPNQDTFIAFQNKAMQHWYMYNKSDWQQVASTGTIENLYAETSAIVHRFLNTNK